jgi:hypothetical protein
MGERLLDVGLDLEGADQVRLHTERLDDTPWPRRERETKKHINYLMEEAVPLGVVANLEKLDARWHPSGFMVFALGYAPGNLGTRRLHIWPEDLRQRENRGLGLIEDGKYDGDDHNHRWGVFSKNIRGYEDDILHVEEQGTDFTARDVVMQGLYWRFRPNYLKEQSVDALVNTGNVVSTSIAEHRQPKTNDFHTILPHVYHRPTIPDDKFAATLVVNTPIVLDTWELEEPLPGESTGPDILIRGATEPIVGARRVVTLYEKLYAKAQLVETLIDEPYNFPLQGVLAATHQRLADMGQDVPSVAA